ncbi:uncharacterized protein TEOVI_000488900 [Trypanosoma equiperdum]|uniref:Uncharacterized protein n=2 Tax=Trypanozoon TaxID=39700 RepID=Q385M6_TRYB2|nr:hypothetical protein, conserved [Trypanosoma brucei brucei TREU927]EAN79505.1 hypothetical protein, conserved [Trypanosoma brucei brucei TREU927]SCU66369.1 hypothetical protein, conserved [Trypanosoma equiperdum]
MTQAVEMAQCDRVVIFLDVDGVLLPVPRFTFGGGDLSPQCVGYLLKIVDACGTAEKVTIILSSTWRNFPAQVQRLNNFFAKTVGDAVPPIAGGTPNGTPKVTVVSYYADDPSEQRLVRDRVDEIKRWINTNMREHPEAVGGRWFAIDDMQLDVDERMRGHFLKTTTEIGLVEDDIERAREIIAAFPPPEEAARNAAAALVDPALKDEEIDILETRCRNLSETAEQLKNDLAEAHEEIRRLQGERTVRERDMKELTRRFEDVSYRLAQYDFSKKNAVLRSAIEALASKTGKERRELEDRIKTLVNLLRHKKELEKMAAKNRKKEGQAQVKN